MIGRVEIIVALATSLTAVASGQTMKLALSSEKPGYALGEPIVLRATITNQGAQAVNIVPLFDPTAGLVRYIIIGTNGTGCPFNPAWLDEIEVNPTPLQTGDSATGDVRLYGGAGEAPFIVAGTYSIVASLGGLRSVPLTVVVTAPQNADEQTEAQLILGDGVGLFMLAEGGEHLQAARSNLEQLVQRYPQSLLGGYASYALGAYYAQDARDFKANRVRPADFSRAAALLETALSRPLLSYFRMRAYAHIVHAYKGLGNPARAQVSLRAFQREFSGDPRAASLIRSAEEELRKR
jgi:hypothetical protein